jgi:hypothetical protein
MQKLIMTNTGQSLVTKLIAGTAEINFTKVKTSDYEYTASDIPTLTDITQVKQTSNVSSIIIVNSSIVKVRAVVNNTGLNTGYYVKAVGLYAKDTSTNEEILFGVSLCDDVADYMPAQTVTTTGISYTFNCKVENTEQVDITVNPSSVVAMEDFEELENTVSTHIISDVNSVNGIHGIRYYNEKLQYYNNINDEWNYIQPYTKLITITVYETYETKNSFVVIASKNNISSKNELINELKQRSDFGEYTIACIGGRMYQDTITAHPFLLTLDENDSIFIRYFRGSSGATFFDYDYDITNKTVSFTIM